MKKAVVMSTFAAASLVAAEFGIEAGYQQNKLSGDFAYGIEGQRTEVSPEEIGLDDGSGTLKPRVYIKSGAHTFDFDYEAIDHSGSKTLQKTITFNEQTYNVGADVTSTYEMNWFRAGYRYNLHEDEKSYANIGLDLHIIDTEVGMKTTGIDEQFSETIPLPTLTVAGSYKFTEMVGAEAKLSGITAGDKGSYVEVYGGLNLDCLLVENGMWRAGYQYKNLDVDVDDFDGDLKMDGVYVGFNYRF